MKIYVASSWRNSYQPDVVRVLRDVDHDVYDFRNPSTGGPEDTPDGLLDGVFHWSDIDPAWEDWDVDQYRSGLQHPLAEAGFAQDYRSMQWAEACVLVLPCGRSAHLEAGWFVGQRRPLLILTEKIEPELMYKMADDVFSGLRPLMIRLEEIEDVMQAVETQGTESP